jgi:ketosteroid isomerase-like protein
MAAQGVLDAGRRAADTGLGDVASKRRAAGFGRGCLWDVELGDLEAFLALTAEDVEFTSMVAEAEGTVFRGHDGVRAWWNTVRGAFEDVHWELLDVRGSGDRGVMQFRMAGTLGGVPVEQTMWQATLLRDGKAIWWAFFRSEREALEAVGLSE